MQLVYLTAKRFPATTADHWFVYYMAQAFVELLGANFSLVIAGKSPDELAGMKVVSAHPPEHFKSLYYFFWLPVFGARHKCTTKDTVFFSNDPHLLSILIFWKRLLRWQYKICSDWHMQFGTKKDVTIPKYSDALVATTETLKHLIVGMAHIAAEKVVVVYGGVDLSLFSSRSQAELREHLGLPQADTLVGYVGFYTTLGMSKGLDTMLQALTLITDEKVKMVFVGGRDTEIEQYTRMAKELGVADRALFIPAVPSREVPAYEQAMDMLVIPYPDQPHFRDYGFPMKVYEYMASKKPIVYSNLPIIREVLGDCATAYIPDDAADLAKQILATTSNAERAQEQVAYAYTKVQSYTWRARAERIIAFVQGTL